MDENETTTPAARGGGFLGRLFTGSRGRLILIVAGIAAAVLLIRHFAQNVTPAASSGLPPFAGGTTIYEPTILGGGGGGGQVPNIPVDQPVPLPRPNPAGLTMSQWLYQFKTIGRGGPGLAADQHNISVDPQLTAAQKLQLQNLFGGGPAHRPTQNLHPGGTAGERVAPILPGYMGG